MLARGFDAPISSQPDLQIVIRIKTTMFLRSTITVTVCFGLLAARTPALVAQNQQEMNRQAADEAEKADQKLNRVYQKALSTLDAEGQKLLRTSQRAWVAYRDADAASAADEMRGGSAAPLLSGGTKASLTRERTKVLMERYDSPQISNPTPEPRAKAASGPASPAGAKTKRAAADQFLAAYQKGDRAAAAQVAVETALKPLTWTSDIVKMKPGLKVRDDNMISYKGGMITLEYSQNPDGSWVITSLGLIVTD